MAIHFTHCFAVLPVADLVKAQEYYRDVLQFTINWRDGDYFGQVSNGEVSLFFQKAESPLPSFTIILNTENADTIYEAAKSAGADIVEPIATRYWGMREFSLRDQNGHILRISHVDESNTDFSSFESG